MLKTIKTSQDSANFAVIRRSRSVTTQPQIDQHPFSPRLFPPFLQHYLTLDFHPLHCSTPPGPITSFVYYLFLQTHILSSTLAFSLLCAHLAININSLVNLVSRLFYLIVNVLALFSKPFTLDTIRTPLVVLIFVPPCPLSFTSRLSSLYSPTL